MVAIVFLCRRRLCVCVCVCMCGVGAHKKKKCDSEVDLERAEAVYVRSVGRIRVGWKRATIETKRRMAVFDDVESSRLPVRCPTRR